MGVAAASNTSRVMDGQWPAHADREPCFAGVRVRRIEAGAAGCDHYGAGHFYISQSDKGGLVFGGDIDGYNTYAQRGNLPVVEDVARAAWHSCR